MASSIVESLMGLLGPQVIGPVASQLGESTDTVQRGLQTGSAAMLAGLVAKIGQPGFLGQVFSLITNPANGPSALSTSRRIWDRWPRALRPPRSQILAASFYQASSVQIRPQ
jgi:hypothetical protein